MVPVRSPKRSAHHIVRAHQVLDAFLGSRLVRGVADTSISIVDRYPSLLPVARLAMRLLPAWMAVQIRRYRRRVSLRHQYHQRRTTPTGASASTKSLLGFFERPQALRSVVMERVQPFAMAGQLTDGWYGDDGCIRTKPCLRGSRRLLTSSRWPRGHTTREPTQFAHDSCRASFRMPPVPPASVSDRSTSFEPFWPSEALPTLSPRQSIAGASPSSLPSFGTWICFETRRSLSIALRRTKQPPSFPWSGLSSMTTPRLATTNSCAGFPKIFVPKFA